MQLKDIKAVRSFINGLDDDLLVKFLQGMCKEAIAEKDHQIATLMCDIEEMYSREDVDHLIGVEREATKEKLAKAFEGEEHGQISAAIRSMK